MAPKCRRCAAAAHSMRLRSIRRGKPRQLAAAEPPPYLPLVLSRRLARKKISEEKPASAPWSKLASPRLDEEKGWSPSSSWRGVCEVLGEGNNHLTVYSSPGYGGNCCIPSASGSIAGGATASRTAQLGSSRRAALYSAAHAAPAPPAVPPRQW